MRVTDQQLYASASARLMKARAEQVEASEQVQTGKRVAHPWDDPSAAGLIGRHAAEKARARALEAVSRASSDELQAVDGALDQMGQLLTRAHELAVQMANDTYGAGERAAQAGTVDGLLKGLVGQLNTRFGDRYVFGGMRDGAPPFDATGTYSGDGSIRQVETAPGVLQDASVRADVAFKGAGGGVDLPAVLTALSTALSTNDEAGIRAAVGTLAQGVEQLSTTRARVGGMASAFDAAAATARTFIASAEDARATLEEVDFFGAATRLAASERALEASMSATTVSLRLSLLDKLG